MHRFVSVHFPKAGGTSLTNQLLNMLRDQVLLDYKHDPVASMEAGTVKACPLSRRYVGVHGHFRPDRYIYSSDCAFITYLREPVENLISIYYFWKECPVHGNPVHERFIRENWSIIELAQVQELRFLMSRTYFSSFDMNRFDFIGFLDNRENDIIRLGNILGVPLSASVHDNKTISRIDDERADLISNRNKIGGLRNLLREDISFYERLKAVR